MKNIKNFKQYLNEDRQVFNSASITTEEEIDGATMSIDWELGERIESVGDGHEYIYSVYGTNADDLEDKRQFIADVSVIDGEPDWTTIDNITW